jgi:hypothetical protein
LNGRGADRNACPDRQCDGVARFHRFLLLTSDERQESLNPATIIFKSSH